MIEFLCRALAVTFCLFLVANWSDAQDSFVEKTSISQEVEPGNSGLRAPAHIAAELPLPDPLEVFESDKESSNFILDAYGPETAQTHMIMQVVGSSGDSPRMETPLATERFQGQFSGDSYLGKIGTDLYSAPDFKGGLIVFGENVAMKLGGYVKADFIYDFDPIDSTDSFVTTSIPVDAPPRTNSRFHARQTRLSFDTRWAADEHSVRVFVEGDFFSDNNAYRLRHAYGEVGSLLVGQTWTTFTDVAAAPATLDFEGSVSSVNRRQALVRWTQPILYEGLTFAISAENPQFEIVPPTGITGEAVSPTPDFVTRLRLSKEWGQFQAAYLHRIGGFQPTGSRAITNTGWGLNFTGVVLVSDNSKFYYQVVFGEGIGSYRGLPDAAPQSTTTAQILGMTGWMVGFTHDWTDRLNSNFTYAENSLNNSLLQPPDDVHKTTYLAANLIWNPMDRVKVGIEYLNGLRENINREKGEAHRLQVAFIFDLP